MRFIKSLIIIICFLAISINSNAKPTRPKIRNNKNNINNIIALEQGKIYFFSKRGCPYCKDANKYIEKNYKDKINMEILSINDKENANLLIKTALKFGLDTRSLGVPFFVLNDKYILGWSEEKQKEFDEFAKLAPKSKKVQSK